MKLDDVTIEVAAKNGRDQRLVVVRWGDLEFRDTFNTDSRTSRNRFIKAFADEIQVDEAELVGLETRLYHNHY